MLGPVTQPVDDFPDGVDTERVAGVAVPAVCRDRIDETALRAAVAALEEHSVGEYRVSPAGGLLVELGARRPDRIHDAVTVALSKAGHGLHDHGFERGYRRLRVALVPDQ